MRNRKVRIDSLLFQPPKNFEYVNNNIYGYLYNWYAANDQRNIANHGWRVPTKNDYIDLIQKTEPQYYWNGGGWTTMNNPNIFGLREVPQAHPRWNKNLSFGTNALNLSLYPNSCRFKNGEFPTKDDVEFLGKMGFLWTSNEGVQEHEGVLIKFLTNYVGVFGDPVKSYSDKRIGAGVRLIRNVNLNEINLPNGSFVDNYIGNDGKEYRSVKIDDLIWTAENVSETKFRNGDDIDFITDPLEWSLVGQTQQTVIFTGFITNQFQTLNIPDPHPGPQNIIAGTVQMGYFGHWNNQNDGGFITRDDLIDECNISGNELHDDGWLKFIKSNKILYIAKKPILSNISWNDIYECGAVYGTNNNGPYVTSNPTIQNKTIEKNGYVYRIKLLTGANENPGESNGGEWDELLEKTHNLSSHNWDSFTNNDLGIGDGAGKNTWCQETHKGANYPTRRIVRGRFGIQSSHGETSSFSSNDMGWRPLLELIESPTTTEEPVTTTTTEEPVTTTTTTEEPVTTTTEEPVTTTTTEEPVTTTTTEEPVTTTTTEEPVTTTTTEEPVTTTTTTTEEPIPFEESAKCCFNNNCDYSFKLSPSQKDLRLLYQIVDQNESLYGFLYNWWVIDEICGGEEKKSTYGYLYNYYSLNEIVNPEMENWRVPTDNDWKELEIYICILETEVNNLGWRGVIEGNKLKSNRMVPQTHPRWNQHNFDHTDDYNFTVHPAGHRGYLSYQFLGTKTFFWTKNEYDDTNAWFRELSIDLNNGNKINRNFHPKWFGCSVRLVRKATLHESTKKDGSIVDEYIGNDGKEYTGIKIGKQVWLGENLMETKNSYGEEIPLVENFTVWMNLTTPAMCYYGNIEELAWSSMWRVPYENDIHNLKEYLINGFNDINSNNIAVHLKSCRQINSPFGDPCSVTEHPRWNEHMNHNGLDTVGFNSLPGGMRSENGDFDGLGTRHYFWLQDIYPNLGKMKIIYNELPTITSLLTNKRSGRSIKILRNTTIKEKNMLLDGDRANDYVGNDGVRYETIKIGDFILTKNNLIETKYRNKENIPLVQNSIHWSFTQDGARCSYENDDKFAYHFVEKYVYLYTQPI